MLRVRKENSLFKRYGLLGSVDNSDLDVPRLVRGIQFDLTLCNRLAHEARSLDPADKPRDVGAQKVNCQHALVLASCLTLASCTTDMSSSPNNRTNIPEKWASKDSHYKNQKANLACMPWWHQYHDPALNQLIELGLKNNNNIHVAMANIEAAQGELKRVQLNWIPSLGGNAGYSSFPYLGFPGVLVTAVPTYTINIFSQIKEQQRARHELNVTQAMRDSVKLAVIAQISGNYFSYLAQREQLQLLQVVDQDLTKAVNINTSAHQSGITAGIQESLAKSELDLIKAEELVIKNNIVISQNALRYLLNENPRPFHFKHQFTQINSHQMLIGSLPLNVIENRPDMVEAVNALKASHAGVGMAISHLLPTVQLSAARGDIATVANGTTLGMPIYFNQALVQQPLISLASLGDIDKFKGIQKAAYYRYIDTLRAALRDVNNDLSTHDLYTQRLDKSIDAKQNAQHAYQLTRDLYQRGIISYLGLLEEKIKLDKIKILVNKHKLEQTLAIVNLYQDLAVGYRYEYESRRTFESGK